MWTWPDFVQFLWAVLINWAGFSTGGLIIATIVLYFAWRDKTIPRKVTLTLSVIFLFLAFFRAWEDQREVSRGLSQSVTDQKKQIANLQRTIDDFSLPQFQMEVYPSACAHYGEDGTYLFIPVSIQNHGADSDAYFEPSVEYHSPTLSANIPVINLSVDRTFCDFSTPGGRKKLLVSRAETVVSKAQNGIKRFGHASGRVVVKIAGEKGINERDSIENGREWVRICLHDPNGAPTCNNFIGQPMHLDEQGIFTFAEEHVVSVGPQKY